MEEVKIIEGDKYSLLVILITWAITKEWLIASSPDDDKNNFTNYEVCTENNFNTHLDNKWIRLKKNGEAIQLKTR